MSPRTVVRKRSGTERPSVTNEFDLSLEDVETLLNSNEWHELESRLGQYVTNYSRKVVRFRQGFQL